MAGITESIFVERVVRLAGQRNLNLDPANVWSSIPSVLQLLGADVWQDPQRRQYAQVRVTNLAFATGVADISSYTAMLQESWRNVSHTDGDSNVMPVSMAPLGASRQWLSYERNPFSFYGCIEANTLYLVQSDGTTVAPDGTVSLTYNEIPTLANIHAQLIDDAVAKALVVAEKAAELAA